SPDAFYFVTDPGAQPAQAGQSSFGLAGGIAGGAVGGLIGGLIDGGLGGRKDKPLARHVEEVALADLPQELRKAPDWPPDQKKGIVTVMHLKAVQDLQFGFFWFWFRSRFLLTSKLGNMTIFPPLFQGRKLARIMEKMGWEM